MTTAVVVDDSPIEGKLLQRIFTELGVTVVAVESDGARGWAAIEQHRPSICTLDINMPNMNGIEIARRIREGKIAAKIVMCTAMKQGSVRRQLQAIGVDGFIAKPFDDIITARDLKALLPHG